MISKIGKKSQIPDWDRTSNFSLKLWDWAGSGRFWIGTSLLITAYQLNSFFVWCQECLCHYRSCQVNRKPHQSRSLTFLRTMLHSQPQSSARKALTRHQITQEAAQTKRQVLARHIRCLRGTRIPASSLVVTPGRTTKTPGLRLTNTLYISQHSAPNRNPHLAFCVQAFLRAPSLQPRGEPAHLAEGLLSAGSAQELSSGPAFSGGADSRRHSENQPEQKRGLKASQTDGNCSFFWSSWCSSCCFGWTVPFVFLSSAREPERGKFRWPGSADWLTSEVHRDSLMPCLAVGVIHY